MNPILIIALVLAGITILAMGVYIHDLKKMLHLDNMAKDAYLEVIDIQENAIRSQDALWHETMRRYENTLDKMDIWHQAVVETVSPEDYILIDRILTEKLDAST